MSRFAQNSSGLLNRKWLHMGLLYVIVSPTRWGRLRLELKEAGQGLEERWWAEREVTEVRQADGSRPGC